MELPGLIRFTNTSPIITAITVVNIYVMIVLPPIFDSLDMSFKSETPLIREARIKGIAINFKRFINIVPKGFMKLLIKILPAGKKLNPRPKIIPINIPIIIFQCNGRFFISLIYKQLFRKILKKNEVSLLNPMTFIIIYLLMSFIYFLDNDQDDCIWPRSGSNSV